MAKRKNLFHGGSDVPLGSLIFNALQFITRKETSKEIYNVPG